MTERSKWKPYKLDGIPELFEVSVTWVSIPMMWGEESHPLHTYRCIGCGFEVKSTYQGIKEKQTMRWHADHCLKLRAKNDSVGL